MGDEAMLLMNAEQIAKKLDYKKLIHRLADGLSEDIVAPPRHYHHMEDSSDFLLLMPAWTKRWIGLKTCGVFPDNPSRGAEVVAESYLLLDRHAGRFVAMLDSLELTNRRTAAASALAARTLARQDVKTLLVMGAGSLSPYMAEAHAAVRDYERILIWGRSPDKADKVIERLIANGLPAERAEDAEQAAHVADVISCATGASEPIIKGDWLKPGAHLDLVGAHSPKSREADSNAIASALVYADVKENVLREAGEIIIPIAENRITADHIKGDLKDLVSASVNNIRSPQDITVFKSVGFASEDMIAAVTALEGEI